MLQPGTIADRHRAAAGDVDQPGVAQMRHLATDGFDGEAQHIGDLAARQWQFERFRQLVAIGIGSAIGHLEQEAGKLFLGAAARQHHHSRPRVVEGGQGAFEQQAFHGDMIVEHRPEGCPRKDAQLAVGERRDGEGRLARLRAADEIGGVEEPDDLLAAVAGERGYLQNP